MLSSAAALTCLLFVGAAFAVVEEFSYDRQDEWPGVCVDGNQNRQSPIGIDTEAVVFDSDLMDLMLAGWDVAYEGTFSNPGHNLQFDPTTPGQATVQNHLGTYEVVQFHMHWGRTAGTGSEHLISEEANELEIHFVQGKRGNTDQDAGDALSVIAVMGEVDEDADITDPWSQLDASQVPAFEDSINITAFRFDQLLPENLDYYHYMGSPTTPNCNEIVAWFVLRETIKVPAAYLEQLRAVQGTDGEVLGLNYRNPQAIGDRTVSTNSQTIIKPMFSLLVFSLIIIGLFSC